VTPQLTVRATTFANRINDPVFNVTTAIAGANVTQQRQNVPRKAIHGFQSDVEFRNGPWGASAAYMHDDARVKEVNPPASANIPSILGNFLAQVPKNRGSVQVAYANPKFATVSFAVQGTGDQWDDDLNTRLLPSYGTADMTISREITRQFDVYFGMQNMFDKEYVVGTLPTTIGSPRLVHGGVRVTFNGR
jgi:outer membrane receptor protein involved in Fe transport